MYLIIKVYLINLSNLKIFKIKSLCILNRMENKLPNKTVISKFTFIVHPEKISMILLSPNDNMGHFMHIINKWLFYTNEDYFMSFLKNDREINILLSSKLINHKTDNIIKYKKYPKEYKIIQIVEGSTIVSVSGIIHSLTGLFADKNIPILYTSTYVNDYIFVEEDYIDEAKTILIDNGLRIYDDDNIEN